MKPVTALLMLVGLVSMVPAIACDDPPMWSRYGLVGMLAGFAVLGLAQAGKLAWKALRKRLDGPGD
jgi:hypothetical protein